MQFLKVAWDNVTQQTVSNCFFRVVTENVPPSNTAIAPIAIDTPMRSTDFNEYVNVDQQIVATEELDDNAIVATVGVNRDAPETTEDECENNPRKRRPLT